MPLALVCPDCGSKNLKKRAKIVGFGFCCFDCMKSIPEGNNERELFRNLQFLQSWSISGHESRLAEIKEILADDVPTSPYNSWRKDVLTMVTEVLEKGPLQAKEAWVELCRRYPGLPRVA